MTPIRIFPAPPVSNLKTPAFIRDVRNSPTLTRFVFNHSYEKWAIVEAELKRLTPLGRRWACIFIAVEISPRKRVFRVVERKDRFFTDIIFDVERGISQSYYECITTEVKPVKLYFDIVWVAKEVTFKAHSLKLVSALVNSWNDFIREKFPPLVHRMDDVEVLESHDAPLDSTIIEGGRKISFHVVSLLKVYFLSMPAIRKCVTQFYAFLE